MPIKAKIPHIFNYHIFFFTCPLLPFTWYSLSTCPTFSRNTHLPRSQQLTKITCNTTRKRRTWRRTKRLFSGSQRCCYSSSYSYNVEKLNLRRHAGQSVRAMDRQSHWAPTDVGTAGFHQAGTTAVPGGTAAPAATVASQEGAASPPPSQGWALANKEMPQQAHGGEGWGTSTSSNSVRSPNQNAGGSSPLLLDEAINQFGGMTLGAGPGKSSFGAGAIVECQHTTGSGGGGGVDGLNMGSLRLAEEAGGAGRCFGHHPVRVRI